MSSTPNRISLDRPVNIEATPIVGGESHDGVIRIAWIPGSVVFPCFEGTLLIRGDGADSRLIHIELDGSYVQPFGAAGRIFDAAIGRRLAHATAREFLKDVKAAIED